MASPDDLSLLDPSPGVVRCFEDRRAALLHPRVVYATGALEVIEDLPGAVRELGRILGELEADALADRIIQTVRQSESRERFGRELVARTELVVAALTRREVIEDGDFGPGEVVADPGVFELWMDYRAVDPQVAGVVEPTAAVIAAFGASIDSIRTKTSNSTFAPGLDEELAVLLAALFKLRHLDPDAAFLVDANQVPRDYSTDLSMPLIDPSTESETARGHQLDAITAAASRANAGHTMDPHPVHLSDSPGPDSGQPGADADSGPAL